MKTTLLLRLLILFSFIAGAGFSYIVLLKYPGRQVQVYAASQLSFSARLTGRCIHCEKYMSMTVDRRELQKLLGRHGCIEERLYDLENK